jgi:glycerophosphoryl diester phosphodiesterase
MCVFEIYLTFVRAWLPRWIQCLTILFVCSWIPGFGQVLYEGHSHNDFRRRPALIKALENGFHSVEVDIHLHKGELVVAHNGFLLRRKRTLERLYLSPLSERVLLNEKRSVHADGTPGFVLYIDIKDGCPDVVDTLVSQLQRHADMITVWEHGQVVQGAVTVIVGACGRESEWLSSERRWFQFDGRKHHLGGTYDSTVVPRIGMPLRRITKWRGRGTMDPQELAALRATIAQAKAEGRQIRFWAATNKPKVWQLLLDEGVDVINVDRIERFARFMAARREKQ